MEPISVCEPYLKGNELKYVQDAIETNWISSAGSYTTKLEEGFAKYIGTKFATTTNNGTTALHLAMLALGIGPGNEVIVPDFTMVASAFAVCYVGAMPVFVDCEAETWNIDPKQIEAKISKKTKAIMVTHIYGHPCDMEPIMALAKKYNLKVVEDAAEVHGATLEGKKCGSFGDIATFSLFANKIMTCGEGGLVTTSDQEIYDRCRYFKNLCFPINGPRNYIHQDIGHNFRMPNTLAAIAFAQLEYIDQLIDMRRRNHELYRKAIAEIPGVRMQPEKKGAKNVYWMVGATINEKEFGISRDQLAVELKEMRIETRPFFYPMHKQPALLKYGASDKGSFTNSILLSQNGLYLPSSSGLNPEQISYVVDSLKKIHKRKQA